MNILKTAACLVLAVCFTHTAMRAQEVINKELAADTCRQDSIALMSKGLEMEADTTMLALVPDSLAAKQDTLVSPDTLIQVDKVVKNDTIVKKKRKAKPRPKLDDFFKDYWILKLRANDKGVLSAILIITACLCLSLITMRR